MTTLTVGTNRQYATLATALDAARDGDVVAVSSGTYVNDFGTTHSKVTLTAVGGLVTLLATQPLAPGKAILTVTTDAVIDGFVFSGAQAADGTAAGLLDTGGALVVRNSLFTGDQTGLLVRASTVTANGAAAGTVLVQASEFAGNGAGIGVGDGLSGNIAVGAITSLTIQDSYIHDARGGDEVRSLARATTITTSRIVDSTAPSGAAPGSQVTADVDLPKGGTIVIRDTVIEKGPDTAGPAIRIGGDTVYAGTTISIANDTIVSDRAGAVAVQNTAPAAAAISGTRLYGFATVATGLSVQTNDTVPAARPVIDTTPLVVAPVVVVPVVVAPLAATIAVVAPVSTTPVSVAPVTVAPVTVAPVTTTPVTTTPVTVAPLEYGRAGAVVANGVIRTVGTAGQYATLGAALAVAQDGDTIRVAAGTYTDAGVTISHRLIIEGVGGLARFVASGTPANGLAEITTTTDVTLRNIEVSGAAVLGGVAAGIRDQGGVLTLVNSFIHDNQAGLVADRDLMGRIGIYDTELARNGTADGRGLNLDVGEVGQLTLRNDWVHDAPGGGEVRSRADATVIDTSRVVQGTGSGAYAIDLPDGGLASLTGSVVQKGAGSLGGALVHVGGGTVHAGSALTLSGDTLISGVTGVATRFVVAEAGAGGVTAGGTGFQGGAAGSVQVVNGVNTGAVVRTGLAASAAAPWGAAGAPVAGTLTVGAPTAAAAARGVLILRVSGDAYQGNARFTLSVDGVQVGATLTATAVHATGQSQSFTIAGDYAPGPHVVTATLVNDLSGTGTGAGAAMPAGAGAGSRTLYVDGMGFNGEDMHQTAMLQANGAATLSTGAVTRSTPVTVNLSETAWKGDAMAFVSIDGQVQGDIVPVTASHALGRTQATSFLLDLSPGAHTVSVAFLNGTQNTVPGATLGAAPGAVGESRNLYIDSMDIAGAHYAMAAATLGATGASTFAFTVAPPAAANAGLFLTAGLPQAVGLMAPLG